MEGTPHLLTDVKFSERRRGYAPEEVDNFLERVSAAVAQLQDKLREATARAEEADARINEAKRAQTVAEAQVDQLKADLQKAGESGASSPAPVQVPSDPGADAEAASTLLLMAKKTADATIEEARTEAATTLADAQSRASTLVSDAEAESTRIRTDAERIADDLVQGQRAAALAEVVALEEMKGSIQADIQALQVHVDRERVDLRAAVARLAEVIDNPAALRVGEAPVGDTPGFDELVAPAAGVEAIDEVDDPAPLDDEVADLDQTEVEEFDIGQSDDTSDETSDVTSDEAAEDSIEDEDEDEDDSDPDFEVEIIEAAIVETDEGELVEVVEVEVIDATLVETDDGEVLEVDVIDEVEVIELTGDDAANKLFAEDDSDAVSDSGPPTQAFKPFVDDDAREDGFDTPRNEDEDKAMRAFFETDFESMDADKRSRWRR